MRFRKSFHCLFLLSCFVTAFTVSCASNEVTLRRFEFQQPQMGVPFRIVLYAPDESMAQSAADAAFARVAELNSLLSDYDYESELSRLSRTSGSGQRVKVSEDLWRVLERAQFFARESRGAFDVTVGPAVNLWRKARREKKFPDEERLAAASTAVGFEKIKLEPKSSTVELIAPKMRLDLGGIAKGYAVEEAMKVLKKKGILRALVSGGGDLAVSQPPPGRAAWRIELPPLEETSAPSEFLHLKNQAMATSGDLFQFVELGGKRYSHIVDPRTGVGLVDHSRVVIVAKDATTADALSTAVSVLGADKGLLLVEKIPGTAARISRQPEQQVETAETPNFRRLLVDTSETKKPRVSR